MQIRVNRVLMVLLFATGLGAAPVAATPPPAEAFIRQFSQMSISPDGNYIAMLRPFEGRNAIVIQRADGVGTPTVVPSGESINILSYEWLSNNRLLLSAGWSATDRDWGMRREVREVRLIAVDRDGSHRENLGFWGMGNVIDLLPDDPDNILVQRWESRGGRMQVVRLNVNNGKTVILRLGRSDYGDFVSDTRGDVRVLLDGNLEYARLWTQERDSVEWDLRHRSEHFQGEDVSPLKVLENGRFLYVFSNHEGRTGLYRYDLTQNNGMELVYLNDQYDLSSFSYDRDADRMRYVEYIADLPERVYFDAGAERLHNQINRALPGRVERIVSSDRAQNRHIILSSGPGEPPVYYLLDQAAGTIDEVISAYPNLSPDDLSPVEAFSYEASDGTEIPSYLAVPDGLAGPPYPLVVWPHGGPHARRDMDFFVLRQFIATRGYAVFMPNFRGSTGYGNEFYHAGFREWGGKMQTDVTEGVQYLIDQGIADPEHICIVGWSYGAYAALMGAIQTPDLYRCAVAINGVYDLIESDRELGRDLNLGARVWWRHTMGNDRQLLARISPARRAGEIHAPVLIIFSEEDRNIEYGQHRFMTRAMQEAGVSFEERVFEEGDHSMNFTPSMIETYQLLDSFLDRNM